MAEAAVVLSEKDERLVKESWQIMKLDIPRHSSRLFSHLTVIAPDAKSLLTFIKDSDTPEEKLAKTKAHAIKIFTMVLTCESATQLRKKGVVFKDTTAKSLGSSHLKYGILDRHFQAVKESLLVTVEEAVGEKWGPDMKNAWSVAYDHLASAIQREMKPTPDVMHV